MGEQRQAASTVAPLLFLPMVVVQAPEEELQRHSVSGPAVARESWSCYRKHGSYPAPGFGRGARAL